MGRRPRPSGCGTTKRVEPSVHAGLEAAVTPNYERAAMPEQNTDPRAPAQPMDAERLSDLRHYVATSTTPAGSWIPDADGRDTLSELLADRDRLAAQAKTLARAVLAWQRLGDRGFGDPSKWDCYEYRGWKLGMSGCEEFFATEFEAQAIKTACVNAHGLAETVLGAGS